jgi:hypothetical protein
VRVLDEAQNVESRHRAVEGADAVDKVAVMPVDRDEGADVVEAEE